MGSKNRIAKDILPIMLDFVRLENLECWVEPFVGGGNMIDKVPDTLLRKGFDINGHAIDALIAVRDHLSRMPDSLSEEQYKALKYSSPDPINSWLRFVASFGGRFDGGYARRKGSDESTFIRHGVSNAKKQSPSLQGVELIKSSYEDIDVENSLIYCDPPYEGTTGYKTGGFDHAKFWEWCRYQSIFNKVFISEYNAPPDFTCVWQGVVKTNFSSSRQGATHEAVEKLFTLN